MSHRVSVSSADFIRNIGHWQNEALRRPISITHHGRERLVLAAPEEFNAGAAAEASIKSALSELRADADAVLENIEDGFLAFDSMLHVKRSNAIAEAFVGRSRDLLQGASAADFMPQPLGLVLHERLQRVMRTRKPETFEASVQDRHISVRIFPMSDGAAVLFANTTEQHDQRLKLGEANALCAATNSHPQAAGIKLDASGRIREMQNGFFAWSGFQKEDVIGHRFTDLVPPSQRREVSELLEAATQGGGAQQIELTLLGKQGQEVSGLLTLAPIQTEFITHGLMAVWVCTGAAAMGANRAA
jgi:PAS domain S-box-containing protein